MSATHATEQDGPMDDPNKASFSREIKLELRVRELEAQVKVLEEWKQIILGTGTDQEAVIRMAAAEYTEVAVQCWRDANAKLEARVKAAEIREKRIFTIAGRHMFAGDYDRFKQDLDTAPDSA